MRSLLLTCLFVIASTIIFAQNLQWNFTSATAIANTVPNNIIPPVIVVQGNNNGTTTLITTTSASSGYAGASGTSNAGVAARTGVLNLAANGSAYFEFTVTPDVGFTFYLTALQFGSRRTATGPQAYALRSSADGFVNDLATGAFLTSSVWELKSNSGILLSSAIPVTFRLYGYNGTGTPAAGTANWRIDDLDFSVTTLPTSAAPVINSALTASATFNTAFTYSITATNAPSSYSATGLPTGLSINTSSGVISGTPASGTASGTPYSVSIQATNGNGTDTKTLNLTVNKAAQTITFNALPNVTTAAAPFALTASTTSGLPITYTSSDNTVANISGSTLTVGIAGTASITASQAGDTDYLPATSVIQTQTVTSAALLPQSITFLLASPIQYGIAPITLLGTATSGLPITYTSSDNTIASISGNTLSILNVGTVTITATQAGDATYAVATPVSTILSITQAPLSVSGAVAQNKVFDSTTTTTSIGATLNGVIGSDVVTINTALSTYNFSTPYVGTAIAVTPNIILGGADAGKYILTQPTGLSANITKANQTISFSLSPISFYNTSSSVSLLATASSNLPVSYTSSNNTIGFISSSNLNLLDTGMVTVTASQAGDANYNAAIDNLKTTHVIPQPTMYLFGTTIPQLLPNFGLYSTNLSFSSFSSGNNFNTGSASGLQINSTSASNVYYLPSALNNAAITAKNSSFNTATSAYFECSIIPTAGYGAQLSSIEFGSRSTGTGPTEIAMYTSIDNFTNPVTTFTAAANSTWALKQFTPSVPLTNGASPITIRLYGYVPGGSGSVTNSSANNWRVDDVRLFANAITLCVNPTVNLSTTNVSCNGGANGAIDATVNGGSAPYTYAWSNGSVTEDINNLLAVGYTVTVTDINGCTATSSAIVLEPAPVVINLDSLVHPICHLGIGSINITPSGGTAPYTFLWSNTTTTQNLVVNGSGTYSITVMDNNNCINSAAYTLTQPNQISIFTFPTGGVQVNVGDSIIMYADSSLFTTALWQSPSGSSSSTFLYTGIASPADQGTFTITVQDANGCTNSGVYPVIVNPTLAQVAARVFLSGNYNTNTGLMNDNLRLLNLIPLVEPYTTTSPYNQVYTPVANTGGESTSSAVLSNSGNNAIVDWVFLQLRDANNPAIVVATRSALLRRDGEIVDVDGISNVSFNINAGAYYLSVIHRNHLGVMSAMPGGSNAISFVADFTNPAFALYTKPAPQSNASPLTGPTRVQNGVRTLYAGNCNSNVLTQKYITYNTSIFSDRAALLSATGVSSTITGYSIFDCDLNGTARFNGAQPDRLVILQNCVSSNTIVVYQQLP
jgi:hypothetical protein